MKDVNFEKVKSESVGPAHSNPSSVNLRPPDKRDRDIDKFFDGSTPWLTGVRNVVKTGGPMDYNVRLLLFVFVLFSTLG